MRAASKWASRWRTGNRRSCGSEANRSPSSGAISASPDSAGSMEESTIATAAEVQLVYLFAAMLVAGSVLLAFLPILHRTWTFAASRRIFAALIVLSLALAIAVLSEKLVMAVGASILIVRAGLRIRPRETSEMWPIWSAAVLFALAFVVVLPYAIPAFELGYVVSGIIGWSIGVVALVYDL